MEPMKVLEVIVERYKLILGDNLVGIYLHGSLAMGCYTQKSDMDFLVVVREPLNFKTKRKIIEAILNLDNLPGKGIEMSIILKKHSKEFIHPTPFELHYSDYHRHKYISDMNYICSGFEDSDLAAHITIVIHRGICLYGMKITDVFGEVPRKDYTDSIVSDIENAREDILEDPVYISLNLCRVLYYLEESVISSKFEGGKWGIEKLPKDYKKIVENSLKVYTGELSEITFSNKILVNYAEYMLNQINEYIS